MKNNPEDMVTKMEFRKAVSRLDGSVGDLQVAVADLQVAVSRLEETMFTNMVTQTEFRETIGEIRETMYTKADHAKFMEWMDEAMTELRDARDERKLSERQVLRIDDIVFDHEKRIRVLEKK